MKPSYLQTVHLLKQTKKKKKPEPCSVEKKGLHTFAKSINLHLPERAMDLMIHSLVIHLYFVLYNKSQECNYLPFLRAWLI